MLKLHAVINLHTKSQLGEAIPQGRDDHEPARSPDSVASLLSMINHTTPRGGHARRSVKSVPGGHRGQAKHCQRHRIRQKLTLFECDPALLGQQRPRWTLCGVSNPRLVFDSCQLGGICESVQCHDASSSKQGCGPRDRNQV